MKRKYSALYPAAGLGSIRFLLFLFLALPFFSCTKNPEDGLAGVQLRIGNLSTFTLREVRIETGGGGAGLYTGIGPGEQSEYLNFDYTYRYAFVEAIVGADTLRLQPIDYVGEQKFTSGKFTFQIELIGDPPLYMALRFRED